jgi:hypothetical protein
MSVIFWPPAARKSRSSFAGESRTCGTRIAVLSDFGGSLHLTQAAHRGRHCARRQARMSEVEEFFDGVDGQGAAGAGDRPGKGDGLRADGHAVLGVAADLQAAFFHEGIQSLAGVHFSGGMHVEEHGLADRGGADEAAVVGGVLAAGEGLIGFAVAPAELDLEVLRARFQAAAAGHALGEWIGLLLDRRRDGRPSAVIVVAIDGDPAFDPLQGLEHSAAIDEQIADDWEFGGGAELDFLRVVFEQAIDEGRAGLADAAIDDHRACPAHFFQAVAVPGNRSDMLAICSGGHGGDLLQHADHVHVGFVRDAEALPIAGLGGPVLAEDADFEGVGVAVGGLGCHSSINHGDMEAR